MRALAWLLRTYVMRFPLASGKGFVLRHVVPLLPAELREVEVEVPPGGRVRARWDELIGRKLLRDGFFERAEIVAMLGTVTAQSTVIDVGANVGLVTIPLALAAARVIAIEPLPQNIEQLRGNVQRNGLTNVVVVDAAAGAADGSAVLHSAADPAFGSLHEVVKHRAAGDLEVTLRSLDSLWDELGRPVVELVKIDVEGAELEVLEGGRELIAACGPAVLVEVGESATAVRELLAAHGYAETTPPGLSSENRLYRRR